MVNISLRKIKCTNCKKQIPIVYILKLTSSAWKCPNCNKWIPIDLRKKEYRHLRLLPKLEEN